MDTFGKREKQNPDWFEEGIAELEPAIAAKANSIAQLQEKALREDTRCTQEGQECRPTDCSPLRQRLLVEQ